MMRPINLAVVGCGDIALAQHLPAIAEHRHVCLRAVCDVDEGRAAAAAARFGAPSATTDVRAVLTDPSVDAVVVATPPWVTPHLTMEALRAGKDVLCEKPMAISLDVAQEVARVEAETGRLVQVGFTYRHGPLMDTLQRWTGEGRLGSPLLYRLGVFDETWDPAGQPAHHARILDTLRHGPPCLHDGAHAADHLYFLTRSRAVRIVAHGLTSRPEFPAPNYNVAWIEFANGDRATLEIGWFYPRLPDGEFEVIGPRGIATFDRGQREVVLTAGDTTERLRLNDDWWRSCFRIQLGTFVTAVRERAAPVPGTAEGIASLALCQAIAAAMKTGLPVVPANAG